MAEVSWIKLSVGIFDDEKIKVIQTMPEGDTLILMWIRLMCLAGKCNSTGTIRFSNNIPYTDDMLSSLFSIPVNTVRLGLQTFQEFDMLDILDNGDIMLSKWEKHQNIAGMEKLRGQWREASSKYREKQKEIPSSMTSYDGHKTEKIREDIEEDKRVDTYLSEYPQEFEDFCEAYPKHVEKARAFTQWDLIVKYNHDPKQIVTAAKNYARHVKDEDTEVKYMKAAHNFLKDNVWTGYLTYKAQPKAGVKGWKCTKCGYENHTTGNRCLKCGEFRE